jgi:hypothetical protein
MWMFPQGSIKDNLMPLPYKEPSQTLYQLFNTIVEEGRRFANTADLQISDMSAQAPVGTTLAILERTLKTMSAVQARIHYSMKQELRLLKEIIASYTPDEYSYEPVEGHRYAKRADYDDIAVIPVSDPNASTMAQKIVQYQAVFQLAQQAPNLFNMPLLYRQMLDVIGIKEAEKLVPMDEDQKPADPITENQNVLMGKPVKAFAYQDHKAHITVHMMAMQDPKIQQLLQNNPMAQSMQAAMMNHINDHMGMEYRKEIELQLGFNLPATEDESGDDIHINPEVEARLAPLLAQAAQRLFQKNSGEAAKAQAQQAAQDPIVQMQQAELQIKAAEQQRKVAKDQIDAQLRMQQQQIETARIAAQTQIQREKMETEKRMGALQTAAEMQDGKEREVMRIGAELAKQLSSQAHQKEMQKPKGQ